MSPSPVASSTTPLRRRGALALAAATVALGVAVPSAVAAPGVYRGSGADAARDARSDLDVLNVDVVYNRGTGALRTTIRMGSKPPGDVDVLLGARQSGGACGMPFVTLSTNAVALTGEWRGSSGNARAKAKVTYANGVITGAVSDKDLKGRRPSCAMAMVYGAGAAHPLRDTLPAFDVTERVAATPGTDDGTGDEEGLPPDDGTITPVGGDTDGDGVPDDFDGDGFPDDLGLGGPEDPGADGSGSGAGAQLSVKVYGIPKRLARGRSYEARIRIRNDGDLDATKLRVRLARKTGVAMSRRVASVSRVRAGKGVTVHVRVRLTSRRALRTVRVTVTGDGVDERASFRLRRR